jgi:hypothetical protein
MKFEKNLDHHHHHIRPLIKISHFFARSPILGRKTRPFGQLQKKKHKKKEKKKKDNDQK